MKKKIALIGFLVLSHFAEASRPLMSGDIVGRDLNQGPLGWIGHVGLGTGDNVGMPTQLIIEVLNEPPHPVVQFNSLSNFFSRSKYWGSRYGIGDYANGTYNSLVEANHQGWWCPSYTLSNSFVVGEGNIYNRVPSKCGVWRCDTFVAWAFYSAGFPQLMNNRIMLPYNVWSTFPYSNGDVLLPEIVPPKLASDNKEFVDLTVDELNKLDFSRFQEIADIPLKEETPPHIAKEWEFAGDEAVIDFKRGIFLDRLALLDEPNTIRKFIDLYNKTTSIEVKSKILQAIQTHYQNRNEKISKAEEELLKIFYDSQLNKLLSSIDVDKIIRGFISFNDVRTILKLHKKIDNQLVNAEDRMALGLRLDLANISPELQKIYMPVIIKSLKKSNRSDLDDMFFGIVNIRIKSFDTNSVKMIKQYMKTRQNKYILNPVNKEDPYSGLARISFEALSHSLNQL